MDVNRRCNCGNRLAVLIEKENILIFCPECRLRRIRKEAANGRKIRKERRSNGDDT